VPDSALTYSLLCGSAFAAGVINAVAGGGTLLTFPALLAVISPVAANATSTMALLPASFASAWGYRQEVSQSREALSRLWLPSLIGGILGSLAVTRFPERVFENLIPWLLILASTLLVLQKPLGRWIVAHPHEKPKRSTVLGIIFFQLLVGIYGGYFGAGIGILMLSSLAFMGIPDIHRMNAVKSILGGVMNGVTAVIFTISGIVVWKYAVIMALGSIAGGYMGARVARRTKPEYVRAIVIAVGFGVAGYSLYRRWAA
jgi:uncharacterized membrane protein YfcA